MTSHTENYLLCLDCWRDTSGSNYYMLRDEIWLQIYPSFEGILCLECAARRLGRPLDISDFTLAPVNLPHWHQLAFSGLEVTPPRLYISPRNRL